MSSNPADAQYYRLDKRSRLRPDEIGSGSNRKKERKTDQSRNINGLASLRGGPLETTSHGEELIDLRKIIFSVSLRDSLYRR